MLLCFDRCQLTITWMSNIKEGRYKPSLYASVNVLARLWRPFTRVRRRRTCVRAHEQYR